MDRPIMLVFHTLKARTSPTRAELCWFMDGVLPVLSRSCYWVPDSPWGSILAVWGGGRGLAGLPHLQLHQDNALPITREAAAAQRQPWQTGLKERFADRVPTAPCTPPLVFSYLVLVSVMGVGSLLWPQKVSACESITTWHSLENPVPISLSSDFQGITLHAKPTRLAVNEF